MKRIIAVPVFVLMATVALPAAAEVEEVTAGGSIQIRGNVLTPGFIYQECRKDQPVAFNGDNNDEHWTFERTLVNVNAQLSGGVRAFVELQSYDFWGINEDDRDEESESFIANVGFGHYAGQGDDPIKLYHGFSQMDDSLVLAAHYQYTEDLTLTAGHVFFPGTAIKQAFSPDDTTNHLYVQALLTF
jgi:hypothetical protein